MKITKDNKWTCALCLIINYLRYLHCTTGIPIMLMKYSLPQPDADMSLVSPVVVAMFTPLPLWFMIAGREIYR